MAEDIPTRLPERGLAWLLACNGGDLAGSTRKHVHESLYQSARLAPNVNLSPRDTRNKKMLGTAPLRQTPRSSCRVCAV